MTKHEDDENDDSEIRSELVSEFEEEFGRTFYALACQVKAYYLAHKLSSNLELISHKPVGINQELANDLLKTSVLQLVQRSSDILRVREYWRDLGFKLNQIMEDNKEARTDARALIKIAKELVPMYAANTNPKKVGKLIQQMIETVLE